MGSTLSSIRKLSGVCFTPAVSGLEHPAIGIHSLARDLQSEFSSNTPNDDDINQAVWFSSEKSMKFSSLG